MEEKIQGVCLQAISYLGKSRILKIFTEEAGLVTLMSKKPALESIAPFCIAECVYRKGQSEIGTLIDGSLIDSLLDLRQSYSALTASGSIAQDLLRSQLPGKSSPGLYSLVCSYLKKIARFDNPLVLSSSFRLKLLLHEGLLVLEDKCARCEQPSSALNLGESVCRAHASIPDLAFNSQQWDELRLLGLARQFSVLQQIDVTPDFKTAIDLLFEERLANSTN